MFRERNNIIDFQVVTFQTCKKRNGASETRSLSYSLSPSSYHRRKQICHRRLDRLRCPLSPRLIILQHPSQFRRDVIDSQRTEVNCSFSSMDFHLPTVSSFDSPRDLRLRLSTMSPFSFAIPAFSSLSECYDKTLNILNIYDTIFEHFSHFVYLTILLIIINNTVFPRNF